MLIVRAAYVRTIGKRNKMLAINDIASVSGIDTVIRDRRTSGCASIRSFPGYYDSFNKRTVQFAP